MTEHHHHHHQYSIVYKHHICFIYSSVHGHLGYFHETCMWNVERWQRGTYLQGRNRDANIENRNMDIGKVGPGWDALGDKQWHIYSTMCKVGSWCEAALQHRSSAWCSVMTQKVLCDGGVGGKSRRKGIYVYMQLIHFVVQQKLT